MNVAVALWLDLVAISARINCVLIHFCLFSWLLHLIFKSVCSLITLSLNVNLVDLTSAFFLASDRLHLLHIVLVTANWLPLTYWVFLLTAGKIFRMDELLLAWNHLLTRPGILLSARSFGSLHFGSFDGCFLQFLWLANNLWFQICWCFCPQLILELLERLSVRIR